MTKQKEFSQTQIRIPTPLYEELKDSADRNLRSLNAEILYFLLIGMDKAEPPASSSQIREIVREELAKAGNG